MAESAAAHRHARKLTDLYRVGANGRSVRLGASSGFEPTIDGVSLLVIFFVKLIYVLCRSSNLGRQPEWAVLAALTTDRPFLAAANHRRPGTPPLAPIPPSV